MFNILSFPQDDYSLSAWVERISVFVTEHDTEGAMTELTKMSEFFSRHRYGPYMACRGRRGDAAEVFLCERHLDGWTPSISEPTRKASVLLVHSDCVLVAFNMHGPIMERAGMNILNFSFIACLMLFSGLFLTTTVTELAVRPLERMLMTVRQIATTVFKFSNAEEELKEDISDINSSSEMILLEKVVEKLATIASLQTKEQALQSTEGMEDEDIGVLSMMQGKTLLARSRARSLGELSDEADIANVAAEGYHALNRASQESPAQSVLEQVRLQEVGVSHEIYESWAFNTLSLTDAQRYALAVYTIANFHDASEGEGFIRSSEDYEVLTRFVKAVQKEYPPNPFHSFSHAVDVAHGVSKMMRLMTSDLFLEELEQYALLIAALGHDIGHLGVNNGFLLEVGHDLALQYNDRSPLENMHCAKLYSIVANPEANIFQMLSKEQYKAARKQCIETILHTDMMSHQALVKELQMTYQVNSEVFAPQGRSRRSVRISMRTSRKSCVGIETDVFAQPDVKILTLETILHSADVSNQCRTWEVSHQWAFLVLEEFFAQGDQEKQLGIPVQFLNDRENLNRPNSQIGFIEFVIAPFFAAQIRLWPGLRELGDNLSNNIRNWEDLWVNESCPPEEEKEKVSSRVLKVSDSLEAASLRAPP